MTSRLQTNMLRPIIFGLLLLTVNSYPVNEEEQNTKNNNQNASIDNDLNSKNVEEIKKILNDVAYVENFKNMMAEYVKSQYTNLTDHEMEEIKEHLEEFCHKFAIDLKSIMENGVVFTKEPIEDGLPDSTFENVKNCFKTELPGIKEDVAEDIAYVLRKNLFSTRQKIDRVINNSRIAAIENS